MGRRLEAGERENGDGKQAGRLLLRADGERDGRPKTQGGPAPPIEHLPRAQRDQADEHARPDKAARWLREQKDGERNEEPPEQPARPLGPLLRRPRRPARKRPRQRAKEEGLREQLVLVPQ